MTRWRGPVLLDANVLVESHRIGALRALLGGYQCETVEACFIETQTGHQRRNPEQNIDPKELREKLKAINNVSDTEMASAILRDAELAKLDIGERMLWAHAVARALPWVLCGPDRASLRIGLRLGMRSRLVSLEQLLNDAGFRPQSLREAYTRDFHERAMAQLAQSEGLIA